MTPAPKSSSSSSSSSLPSAVITNNLAPGNNLLTFETPVSTNKRREVLVELKVLGNTLDTLSLELCTNQDRSKTLLPGQKQGDHSTAYTAILMALLSTADLSTVGDLMTKLTNMAEDAVKGVSESEKKKLELELAAITGNIPNVHNHKQRVAADEVLTASQTFAAVFISKLNDETVLTNTGDWSQNATTLLEEYDISVQPMIISSVNASLAEMQPTQMNFEMKHSKLSQWATYINDLSKLFLKASQLSDVSVFMSTDRKKFKSQNTHEKEASNALLVIDRIYNLFHIKDEAEFNKELEKFKQSLTVNSRGNNDSSYEHAGRYGFNQINKKLGGKQLDPKKVLKTLNSKTTQQDQKTYLQEIYTKILANDELLGDFIGSLFDYDRVIYFSENPSERLGKQINNVSITKFTTQSEGYDAVTGQETASTPPYWQVTKTNLTLRDLALERHKSMLLLAYPFLDKVQVKHKGKPLDEFVKCRKDEWREAAQKKLGQDHLDNYMDIIASFPIGGIQERQRMNTCFQKIDILRRNGILNDQEISGIIELIMTQNDRAVVMEKFADAAVSINSIYTNTNLSISQISELITTPLYPGIMDFAANSKKILDFAEIRKIPMTQISKNLDQYIEVNKGCSNGYMAMVDDIKEIKKNNVSKPRKHQQNKPFDYNSMIDLAKKPAARPLSPNTQAAEAAASTKRRSLSSHR